MAQDVEMSCQRDVRADYMPHSRASNCFLQRFTHAFGMISEPEILGVFAFIARRNRLGPHGYFRLRWSEAAVRCIVPGVLVSVTSPLAYHKAGHADFAH